METVGSRAEAGVRAQVVSSLTSLLPTKGLSILIYR